MLHPIKKGCAIMHDYGHQEMENQLNNYYNFWSIAASKDNSTGMIYKCLTAWLSSHTSADLACTQACTMQ